MKRRTLDAEALTLLAIAEPTSATPVLFVETTSRATLTVPAAGIYDIAAIRAQGSCGIAEGGMEIVGNFSLSAGDPPPIVVGADGANALMCGDAGLDGGAHVD
jgi:hypothetical protein